MQNQKASSIKLQGLDVCLERIAANASNIDDPLSAPVAEFRWLAECGALKVVLPGEALDFAHPNTAALLDLLKRIGMSNLSVGRIYEGHINALYLIYLYATETQKLIWYNAVIHEQALFGVWNTQAKNGIDFKNQGQGLTLYGEKTFCSGVSIVTHALVTGNIANSDRNGWQMMILDMSKVGADQVDRNSWQTMGMKASGSFTTDFTGYHVSENELLGLPGDYLKQPYFNGGAIRFAAVQFGGAEAILHHTLKYLEKMDRTGDLFQKARIAAMLMDITTGKLWLQQAGINFDKWVDDMEYADQLIAFANMTRTVIEDIGLRVMQSSNVCVGARGLMAPSPLELLNRDLTFYLRQPAPDATRLAIADYLINLYN
ncbi:acyl-CoA dehydrogenase [Mucilaginibacter sp. JRF]|uniref:acyl-CoA dehydrogenase n=1 Tax=Mucilaginibacter sp. JRF TaxID=2780088 RepID=UPI00187F30D1|nr:acyl-CoA dehydrogenase [Mucilaginibacter sp. JRF]MBE9584234.1 acyl-CoA dehydrogenase [Mucilaginibacter sp. JRF]